MTSENVEAARTGISGARLEERSGLRDLIAREHRVDIVPGATHRFEEPGALKTAADLARDWFLHHLTAVRT